MDTADEWMARARVDREEQERLIREIRALGFEAVTDLEYCVRYAYQQSGDERTRCPQLRHQLRRHW